jgi:hypothetical protein
VAGLRSLSRDATSAQCGPGWRNVPGKAELAGLALHRPAEPHALDLALDHGLEPHVAHGYTWMVTGVPKGSVSARRLMVSLSMRTQPFDTGRPSFSGW